MAHLIMLVPATLHAGVKTVSLGLLNALQNKNVRATILPAFDTEIIEQILVVKHPEDLFESILEQCKIVSCGKDILLINGLPLTRPYAAELNLAIAKALDAAVIFVTSFAASLQDTARQLKIITEPYQRSCQNRLLGLIGNQADLQEAEALTKCVNSFGIKLPLLGSIPYRNELRERSSDSYVGTTISKYFELNWLWPFLNSVVEPTFTPTMFRHRVFSQAKEANKRIVLPEGDEPRTLQAVNICMTRGIARCVLLGNRQVITDVCNKNNISLHEQIEIIDPEPLVAKYADPLCEARRGKGLTLQAALKQLEDNTVLGTMMLHLGEVDGLVSGAVHTTANTLRPALQVIKTAKDAKLVSSIFFMCLPDQVLVYGDCAMNPNPNAEELADIAIQSAKSALAFGITPRIAMLSYSTGDSGAGPDVDKVKAATEIAKLLQPHLEIDGPLQYDAAIDETVAALKAPDSKVAGRATVFIVPDLNVGNITYKAVQRSTGIVCVGPMLQGLRKPVNDLSRGCSVEDIIFTIAITAVQAGSTFC